MPNLSHVLYKCNAWLYFETRFIINKQAMFLLECTIIAKVKSLNIRHWK